MPVVINDFEVVPVTEPPPRADERPDASAGKPELDRPELEHAMDCLRQRLERVRAH